MSYSQPFALLFDSHIASSTGVQQGDPGAPALFSVGLQGTVENVKSRFNTWYLDDASTIDDPATVLDDVKTLVPELKKLGLEVDSRKCEIILLNIAISEREAVIRNFKQVLPDVRVLGLESLSLLGAPLSPEQLSICMDEKTRTLEVMSERLRRIDEHQATVLLKSAFSTPKILYTLRTTTAYRHMDSLREWDDVLRRTFSAVTNVPLNDDS